MREINNGLFTGERALYHEEDLKITNATFDDGESPLKEGNNLIIDQCTFKWKYPLWYCFNIEMINSTFLETARSGIWYTSNITISDALISAPKTFRRSRKIVLNNVSLPHAEETLWCCEDIKISNVNANGDYFGLNSKNILLENFHLTGNYAFDGGQNIEIRNSVLLSKDAFWNCENVTIYDSVIIGEYLGWNSKNVTFIRCQIDSKQGMCYMENVKLVDCVLNNTDLAFEFCTVDASIVSEVDSIKNPISGRIKAKKIKKIILNQDLVNVEDIEISEDYNDEE